MAYKRGNLTPIANNGKAGVVPALWMYWNENNDTLTTAGLIKEIGMSVGDQVIVVNATKTGNAFYSVSAKASDGSITLVANS